MTIVALAEREQLPLQELSVQAEGVAGRRPDGRFGFVRIEQTVAVTTDASTRTPPGLIAKAEETCLVAVSLDLPVQTTVELRLHAQAG